MADLTDTKKDNFVAAMNSGYCFE